MILSDKDLKQVLKEKKLVISPLDLNDVQPSSIDLHLCEELLVFDNHQTSEIDVRQRVDVTRKVIIPENGFVLHPGEFVLGSTTEYFELPGDLAGKLEGKSSLGRLGLVVHATAGFIDPGFKGNITYEITNISRIPIRIYGDMKVAQICFLKMTSEVENLYGSKKLGSKYSGQRGPTASMGYKNFKK